LWLQQLFPHERVGSLADLGTGSRDAVIGSRDDDQFRRDAGVLEPLVQVASMLERHGIVLVAVQLQDRWIIRADSVFSRGTRQRR